VTDAIKPASKQTTQEAPPHRDVAPQGGTPATGVPLPVQQYPDFQSEYQEPRPVPALPAKSIPWQSLGIETVNISQNGNAMHHSERNLPPVDWNRA
jgi:hypothetical protein